MMQAASDIFLGWTKGVQENRHLYWRQLRDMKGSIDVETMVPIGLDVLRAHLRVDPGARPRPFGRPGRDRGLPRQDSDAFDKSITDFSERYADQNEQTTRPSPRRSGPDASRPSRASEHMKGAPGSRPGGVTR